MEQVLDHFNEDPEGFVLVEDDKIFIDPRKVGNDAQYINHSCYHNAELKQVRWGTELLYCL